jgi:hypothetical protein
MAWAESVFELRFGDLVSWEIGGLDPAMIDLGGNNRLDRGVLRAGGLYRVRTVRRSNRYGHVRISQRGILSAHC